MEYIEFDTTLLTVPFLCDMFALALTLLMRLGAASFAFIYDINSSSAVSTTSETFINPKIRSLLCKISLKPPLIRFLDISATHALSLYGMFLSVVTFFGSYLTFPSVKNLWAQVFNSWSNET